MKLDTRAFRYLSTDDWRVLAAVEQGSKNHEVVPTPLINQIAGLRGGSAVHKCISSLAKVGLVAKVKNAKYDGYRLTYGGLDYLALHTHRLRTTLSSLGNQIGVGKESDIYITASPQNRQYVLKLHRLGRISFRTVKANRDYLRNRSTGSWMYLSRLAAQKEFAFMRVLHREGFRVPEPIAWSRHTVVMEFIDAFPLRMVESVPAPGKLYAELMEMIVQLAHRGLIHGDFNEFNILIKEVTVPIEKEEGEEERILLEPVLIDFPQTVSTDHANAEMYFARDVACVKRYFERRFKYASDEAGPFFKDVIKGLDPEKRLDVEVEASGFSRKMARELERYVEKAGGDQDETVDKEEGHGDGAEEEGEGEDVEDEQGQDEEITEELDEVPQAEASALEEGVEALSLGDRFAVKPLSGQNLGLMSLEVQNDPDIAAEQVHRKKQAAGWAI